MRKIVLVGDLHVGSVCGLWPEEYKTPLGNVIYGNEKQRELFKFWNEFCDNRDVRTSDTIILMGDLCQGNNRRKIGEGTVTPELDIQVNVATELLKPLCAGKDVYGVIGSGYHNSVDMYLDDIVVEKLGGTSLGFMKNLHVSGTDITINVAHGVGGGALYSGGNASKEGLLILSGIGRNKLPKIGVIIRGHLHHFVLVKENGFCYIQTPCWQTWYPFKSFIKEYGKRQPDIGGVVLTIDGSFVQAKEILFDTPKVYDVSMDI